MIVAADGKLPGSTVFYFRAFRFVMMPTSTSVRQTYICVEKGCKARIERYMEQTSDDEFMIRLDNWPHTHESDFKRLTAILKENPENLDVPMPTMRTPEKLELLNESFYIHPFNHKVNLYKMNTFMGVEDTKNFLKKLEEGATPLMLAAKESDLDNFMKLCKEGADPTEKTHLGVTLLHFAAVNEDFGMEIVSTFSNLLDVRAKDIDGEEPIHYALRKGNYDFAENVIWKVLSRTSPLRFNTHLDLFLFFVVNNELNFAKLVHQLDDSLMNSTGYGGKNALHHAAQFAGREMCQWLIEQGLDPESLSKKQSSPLHFAMRNKEFGAMLATFFFRINYRLLNHTNLHGMSPLHVAIKSGNTAGAQRLLDLGASTKVKCLDLQNLLHFCVKKNRLEIAKMIHSNDGNLIKEVFYGGRTALHFAVQEGHVDFCEWLISAGVDVGAVDINNRSAHDYLWNILTGNHHSNRFSPPSPIAHIMKQFSSAKSHTRLEQQVNHFCLKNQTNLGLTMVMSLSDLSAETIILNLNRYGDEISKQLSPLGRDMVLNRILTQSKNFGGERFRNVLPNLHRLFSYATYSIDTRSLTNIISDPQDQSLKQALEMIASHAPDLRDLNVSSPNKTFYRLKPSEVSLICKLKNLTHLSFGISAMPVQIKMIDLTTIVRECKNLQSINAYCYPKDVAFLSENTFPYQAINDVVSYYSTFHPFYSVKSVAFTKKLPYNLTGPYFCWAARLTRNENGLNCLKDALTRHSNMDINSDQVPRNIDQLMSKIKSAKFVCEEETWPMLMSFLIENGQNLDELSIRPLSVALEEPITSNVSLAQFFNWCSNLSTFEMRCVQVTSFDVPPTALTRLRKFTWSCNRYTQGLQLTSILSAPLLEEVEIEEFQLDIGDNDDFTLNMDDESKFDLAQSRRQQLLRLKRLEELRQISLGDFCVMAIAEEITEFYMEREDRNIYDLPFVLRYKLLRALWPDD
ncbi:Hypothetical predicted protein [Cloeon dipterum]|uniref:Uncharacterized protein n=1 Tax=Cloeon dipterum TaxID=197152 RepID=A0A8S1E927_9INSE|nr:Hypothetical predicted protein [Cloeon dipterum]